MLDAKRVRRGLRLEVSVRSTYEVASQIEAEARRRGYTVGEADYSDTVLQRFAVAEDEVGGLTALAAELSAGAAVVAAGDSGYVDLG